MEFITNNSFPQNVTGILLPFGKERKLQSTLPKAVETVVEKAISTNLLEEKPGSIYAVTAVDDNNFYEVVLLAVDEEDIEKNNNRKVFLQFASAVKKMQDVKAFDIAIVLDNLPALENNLELLLKIVQLPELVAYQFDTYLSKPASRIEKVTFVTNISNFESIQKEAQILSKATSTARRLGNLPNNDLSPADFADKAVAMGKEAGFNVTVLDKEACEKLGMEAFLAVGRGAKEEPKFIVMEYKGDESSDKVFGLVGKGLMFDSGGYSLKPSAGMYTMHGDMCGAAAVVGTMEAIAKMKLKKNVVAVVAACENKVSDKAYMPGDIIGSMAGKTIEVTNTDAEGRITLADALTYIVREHSPEVIVDIATLTGAVNIALGNRIAGAMSNDDEVFALAEKASKLSCDNVWRLHLLDEYAAAHKSKFADIQNSIVANSPGAGTITAGMFLQEFVEDTPWVHLDIASVSWSTNTEYLYPGATGYGVDLMYQMVKAW